jgi:hypothetical protein
MSCKDGSLAIYHTDEEIHTTGALFVMYALCHCAARNDCTYHLLRQGLYGRDCLQLCHASGSLGVCGCDRSAYGGTRQLGVELNACMPTLQHLAEPLRLCGCILGTLQKHGFMRHAYGSYVVSCLYCRYGTSMTCMFLYVIGQDKDKWAAAMQDCASCGPGAACNTFSIHLGPSVTCVVATWIAKVMLAEMLPAQPPGRCQKVR